MRKTHKVILLVFCCSLLAACGEDKKSYAKSELNDDNVFKGQVDAYKKAEAVEQTLHDNFNQQREQIDSAQ